MSAPFAGLTILEYAGFIAGPYCTRLLADLGARVVKLEQPGVGDPARSHGPFPGDLPDRERSGLFLFLGANKKSITLDPALPTGRDLFLRLAAEADVLVEDTRPGAMGNLGLDYEALRHVNPRLIYVSITPYGQDGPNSQWSAYPINSFHASGEGYTLPGGLSHAMFPDRGPTTAGGHLGEYDTGLLAASACVAALFARELGAPGQHLDISKQEATFALNRLTNAQAMGRGHKVDRSRGYEYGGIYQCKDGYVIIYPREDHQWRALAGIMGQPELGDDQRFRTRPDRMRHGEEVNGIIKAWAADLTKEEIYYQVAPSGCPTAPFSTSEDLFRSPQLKERRFFEEIDHPKTGPLQYPTRAYKFSDLGLSPTQPAPLLGQHNEEIFCGQLGLPREELAQMRRGGVI